MLSVTKKRKIVYVDKDMWIGSQMWLQKEYYEFDKVPFEEKLKGDERFSHVVSGRRAIQTLGVASARILRQE